MFLTRSEYDRGVNTFSPEGRLFQVEYAIEATKVSIFTVNVFFLSSLIFQLGSTSIGVRTHEGVVLAAEKRVTTRLMIGDSIEKVSKVDEHIGM
jgi:20S proteasome subunit alpha 5